MSTRRDQAQARLSRRVRMLGAALGFTVVAALAAVAVSFAPPSSAASCPAGSTLTSVGGVSYCVVRFNEDASWTVPSFVSNVDLLLVGGGGGGMQWSSQPSRSFGGGGGWVVEKFNLAVTAGATSSISIGDGGAGRVGAAGVNGGTTTWAWDDSSGTYTASGGQGGGNGDYRGGGSGLVSSDGTSTSRSGDDGADTSTTHCGGARYLLAGSGASSTANAQSIPIPTLDTDTCTYPAFTRQASDGYDPSGVFGVSDLLGCGGGGSGYEEINGNRTWKPGPACAGGTGSGQSELAAAGSGTDGIGEGGGGAVSGTAGSGGSGTVLVRFAALTTELSLTSAGGVAPAGPAYSGVAIGTQPSIQLIDNSVADPVSGVTINVTASGCTLTGSSPTSITTNASGVAAFSGLGVDGTSGANCSLTFTDPSGTYGSITAPAFTVSTGPAVATASTITASPTSVQVASPGNTSTLTVQLLDSGGNSLGATEYTAFGPYAVTMSTSGAAGEVGAITNNNDGTFTATFTGGTATGSVTVSGSMTVGSGGTGTAGSLVSETITMTPGDPAALTVAIQPAAGGSGYSGQPLDTQPVINVVDAYDNVVDSDSSTSVDVVLTQVAGSGSPSLGGSTTQTASSGVAAFSGLSITGSATDTYRLDFTASGLTGVSSDDFQIAREPQTIDWDTGSSASKTYGDDAFAIAAHAEDLSATATNLPITFASSDEAVCTVAAAELPNSGVYYATVTITGAGTCNVTAAQAGDDDYAPTTSTALTYTVAKAAQASLSIDSASSVTLGNSLVLVGTGGSSTSALDWGSTSGPCTVSGTGTTGSLAPTGVGDCVVTLDREGDDNYLDATQTTQTVTIGKRSQSITFTSSVPLAPDAGNSYTAEFASSLGSSYIPSLLVTSGDGTVCSATDNADGTAAVSFIASGTCTLTASQSGDSTTNAASATQTIEVGSVNQTITFPSIDDTTYGALPFTVSASTTSGLPVTFTSSTTSVCTVGSSSGRVTLVEVGTCTITASRSASGAFAAANSVARSFTVAADLPGAPHLTSASAGDTVATVSFVAPHSTGGPSEAIVGYSVRATPSSGPAITQPCAIASPLRCPITGLTNGTSYRLSVAAINSVGTGPFSTASDAIQPATSSNAVTGAYAVPGGTSVHVYWNQLSSAAASLGGGSFLGYELYVRQQGGSWPDSAEFTTATITDTDHNVTGLTSGTYYEFKIVALTTANPNEAASNTVVITSYPVTVPTAPTNLTLEETSDTSVVLTWEAPSSDGGAAITRYTATGTGLDPCIIDPTSQVLRCAFSGLPYDSTIVFSVTARNSMGTGAAATTSFTTPPGPPPYWDGPGITWTPLPDQIASGATEFLVLEGGVPVAATGGPNAERDGWQIEGAGFEMFLVPLGPNREPSGLTPAGGLTIDQGGWMSLGGAGFRAQTTIKFFLLPIPSTQGLAPRAVQTPLYLGHADTSARGEFIDTVYIPSYATAGEWVLQAVGQKSRTTLRSINVRLNITDSQPDWEMQITQRAGFFTGRSAELSKEGKAKLRKLIGSVPMAADHVRVQVTGVSTSLDTRRSNKKLAERRATTVAEFLKARSRDMTVTMRTTTQKTGSSNRDISQSPQPLFTREGKPLTTASVIYDVLQE